MARENHNALEAACVAQDLFLDKDRPLVTPRDYLTDAINTIRGRALEDFLDYGYWVRRYEGAKADVSDIFEVLDRRLSGSPVLTYPERALLGGNFQSDMDLARSGRRRIFPLCSPNPIRKGGKSVLGRT